MPTAQIQERLESADQSTLEEYRITEINLQKQVPLVRILHTNSNANMSNIITLFDIPATFVVERVDVASDRSQTGGGRSAFPPVPKVPDDGIPTKTHRDYYERLLSGDSNQPAMIRKIIRENGEISKGELRSKMIDEGYNAESSGFGASLRVLEDVTKEIERSGRGDTEEIIWTGE